ncbi:hypothetical protein B0H13DRAFT_2386323 [Mycena leptocephala]|nr:hypothetical protein B0H13DRAFT_2386323 [Mycena leptocephala]
MSNHPTRPTIMEVDDIDPLDIRMNSRFLDPLGPILERIPDDERTDITFEHYSMDVDDPVDSLNGPHARAWPAVH